MTDTSLYTGNNDAIATSLAIVSENLCVINAEKTLSPEHSIATAQKTTNDSPPLPYTEKFKVPEDFEDFLIYDSGAKDPDRIVIFGQQKL